MRTTTDDGEVPARYRRLCQQLALARRRGYSTPLLERLQGLMQRGHAVLYRPSRLHPRAIVQFLETNGRAYFRNAGAARNRGAELGAAVE